MGRGNARETGLTRPESNAIVAKSTHCYFQVSEMSTKQRQISQKEITSAIRAVLADIDDIVAVYLFGSTAQNKAHRFSDVDVAVLFEEEMDAETMFRRTLTIGAELETRLSAPVDVVALNRAPIFMRFKIIQTGKLIVERKRTERCLFQMKAMNAYYDAKPYLDYQRSETIRRIQEKGLGYGYQGHLDPLAEVRRIRKTLTSSAASITR